MARADCSRTSFFLAIITSIGDYSNDGFQFSKWRLDLLMFGSRKLSKVCYFYFIFSNNHQCNFTKTISHLKLCEYRDSHLDFVSVTIRWYSRPLRWLIVKWMYVCLLLSTEVCCLVWPPKKLQHGMTVDTKSKITKFDMLKSLLLIYRWWRSCWKLLLYLILYSIPIDRYWISSNLIGSLLTV